MLSVQEMNIIWFTVHRPVLVTSVVVERITALESGVLVSY